MSKKDQGCCGEGSGNHTTCCGTVKEPCNGMKLVIEFMFIDLTTCDRCLDTGANLEAAIADVSTLLQSVGHVLEVHKILVESEEQAKELGFVSSPTIRINGQDIQLEFKESLCGCCGEIAGEDIDCRVWVWQGQEYTTPPKAMIIDAILRFIYGTKPARNEKQAKQVPDNLKRFFAGKARKI